MQLQCLIIRPSSFPISMTCGFFPKKILQNCSNTSMLVLRKLKSEEDGKKPEHN